MFSHDKTGVEHLVGPETPTHEAFLPVLHQGIQDLRGFLGGSDGKESACNVVELGSIPGSGRSPGEGTAYPLQYSCLENSMDKGAWWATVHGVPKSWTRLSE